MIFTLSFADELTVNEMNDKIRNNSLISKTKEPHAYQHD